MQTIFVSCRRFSSLSKFLANTVLVKNSKLTPRRYLFGKQECIPKSYKNYQIVRFKTTSELLGSIPRIHPHVKKIGWATSVIIVIVSSLKYGAGSFLLFLIPLVVLNGRDIHLIIRTFRRDAVFLIRYAKTLFAIKSIRTKNLTVTKLFNKCVEKYPDEIMMQMFDENWTYSEVKSYANKVSRLMQKLNLEKGDSVGIFLQNSPQMAAIVLGLAQLGIISALINTNLKKEGLAHCINISSCKIIIVDEKLAKTLNEVLFEIKKDVKIFQLNGTVQIPEFKRLEDELGSENNDCPECVNNIHFDDPLLYIYTSGTTGLPKAAVLPHAKFLVNSLGSSHLLNLTRKDKVYNPLPLYHTVGLCCGLGPSITLGIPSVIRPQFSASSYFSDCKTYNCTLGMYIGEICRYILMTKPSASDNTHKVTKMLGNGLNSKIWPEFAKRYNVVITELYGATEGNCNMINIDGKVGAVGFIPTMIPRFMYPFHIIKVDDEDRPLRKANGLCEICEPKEPGMLVGMIKTGHIESKYYGYIGQDKSTESKIIRDILKIGDSAFITGDILVKDELLYIYFQDRTGDTYRWKGENVSTLDVETVASKFTKTQCACYGVWVTGYEETKAGMLAIEDPENVINIVDLSQHLVQNLPVYAVPRFLRVVDKIEITGTFKVKKASFIKEGLYLQDFKKLYYFDQKASIYKPLTPEILRDIETYKVTI